MGDGEDAGWHSQKDVIRRMAEAHGFADNREALVDAIAASLGEQRL